MAHQLTDASGEGWGSTAPPSLHAAVASNHSRTAPSRILNQALVQCSFLSSHAPSASELIFEPELLSSLERPTPKAVGLELAGTVPISCPVVSASSWQAVLAIEGSVSQFEGCKISHVLHSCLLLVLLGQTCRHRSSSPAMRNLIHRPVAESTVTKREELFQFVSEKACVSKLCKVVTSTGVADAFQRLQVPVR